MKKSPLIQRILIFGVLSALISLILAIFGFGIVEYYKIRNESDVRLHSQLEILAYNLQPTLLFDDKESADKILLSLQGDQSINRVTVHKIDGKEFTSFVRQNERPDIKIREDIFYDHKLIGWLTVDAVFWGMRERYLTYFLISLLILLISVPASYIISAPIRKHVSRDVDELEKLSTRLRLLAQELSETEQRERKRFARLLHDHLQQLLVASKLRLDLMERKADRVTREEMLAARHFVEQAISAARSLTTELRPPVLYEGGIAPALGYLSRKYEEQFQFKVNLDIHTKAEPDSDIIKWVLYTAVEELLLNIIKYAGVKECMIRLNATEENISVQVIDQGKGFDPAIIDAQKQSGFGLFSIRERIKALDGNLKIDSTPGKGTTFELTIPYKFMFNKQEEEAEEKNKKLILKEAMGELASKDSVRILVADDHQMVRQAISSMLNSNASFKVIGEAEDGEDAVEKATLLSPDIIIMDLNMPKLNGIDATKIIHKKFPDIKIIGLSVQDEETVSDAMREAGAVAFFNKAADFDKLVETIKTCIEPSGAR